MATASLLSAGCWKKYDRDSFYLATKLPIWELKKKEDVKRISDDQLERLGVDHVDFYLLHALDKERWQTVKDLDILPFVEADAGGGKRSVISVSLSTMIMKYLKRS